jgi:hypothetical protein
MSSSSNITPRSKRRVTLKDQLPEIILPRYQDQMKQLVPISLQEQRDAKILKPAISGIKTELKGRIANTITFDILQSLKIDPDHEYPYPINESEDGELEHFSVAVNHEDMYVVCILYDEDGHPTIIAEDNMRSLARNGKGMTVGEATAIDNNGVSLDKGSRANMRTTFLARSKHTVSYGFTEVPYPEVEETDNDKWYVYEYTPIKAHPYQRIVFTIENRGGAVHSIHEATMKRTAFVDKYEIVADDGTETVVSKKAELS